VDKVTKCCPGTVKHGGSRGAYVLGKRKPGKIAILKQTAEISNRESKRITFLPVHEIFGLGRAVARLEISREKRFCL